MKRLLGLSLCVALLAFVPAAWGAHNEQDHLSQDIQDAQDQQTYTLQDISDRAGRFFGGTAKGLANVITSAFSRYGEPNAYIEGEEFSGSFLFGLRYGKGQLVMKDGRRMPIYWQGPSFGVDIGGDAVKVFTLVYHLENVNDIYKRIPGVAGSAYVIGGFSIVFQQSGQLVLAPIHSGVGVRLGASLGYLSYSHEKQWVPL